MKYAAVPFGMTDDFYYFRLPMPFRKKARITIENGTGEELAFGWAVQVKKGRVPKNAAYLHVQWREYMTEIGKDAPILETTGRGHYVGTVLSMQSPYWLRYLEGDERFFVDGEEQPSIHGTGTEDYFNCGWYFNKGPMPRPFHGITYFFHDMQCRTSSYRMHVPDSVPFTKSLRVQIEHGESNNMPYVNYAIVAYWYQDSTSHKASWTLPPAKELRLPRRLAGDPGTGTFFENEVWTIFADLAPLLKIDSIIQAGGGQGGKAEVVPYRTLDENWDGPRRLLVSGDGPGGFVRWQAHAARDDLFAIDLVAPKGPHFGIAELYVDGEPTGQEIDFYSARFHHTTTRNIGPFFMEKGMRWIELRTTGKNEKSDGYNMALGAFILRSGGPWPKEWNVIGPFPGGEHYGYATVYPPEQGVDLDAKYTGSEDKELTWTKLKTNNILWLHPSIKPSANCVAYAQLYVKSPDEREALAFICADDAAKFWFNGEIVWAIPGLNAIKLDKYPVPLTLKAGWNEVLVKVCQSGGNWGVVFRIQDPKHELVYSTTKEPSDDK
jgi:hypothetical protein